MNNGFKSGADLFSWLTATKCLTGWNYSKGRHPVTLYVNSMETCKYQVKESSTKSSFQHCFLLLIDQKQCFLFKVTIPDYNSAFSFPLTLHRTKSNLDFETCCHQNTNSDSRPGTWVTGLEGCITQKLTQVWGGVIWGLTLSWKCCHFSSRNIGQNT